MKDLQLVQAEPSDIDLITDWASQLFEHEDDCSLATHHDFSNNLRNWLLTEINNNNTLYLIAKIDDEAVGFIAASIVINDNGFLQNPTKGVIQLLWTQKKFRQKGVAKYLLKEVEKCIKHLNITYIECSFTAVNQNASAFWSKMGYQGVSTTARKFL